MGTYAEVVRTLQPIIVPVFSAVGIGLEAAQEEHATRKFRRSDDPHYYLHTVRRVAVDRLTGQGLQAMNEEADRPLLPLSSILVFYKGIALRVLRPEVHPSGETVIPVPGRSHARQAFWRQDAGSALPGMETDNILLLWTDSDGVLDEPMTLVRPLGGDHRRNSLRLHWKGKLAREMANLRAADLDELRPDVEYRHMGSEEVG
ncbi:hypothetical protein [Microbispora bryophytorum]|uniref:hypothetical protein n=1 Tax=Microbispora bryophytorum TaxID=1460882 RepID=UPI0033DD875C